MNTQVNFEIAKLLKEKGWNALCSSFYFEDGTFKENELTGTNGYYGDDYCFSQSEFLENWNDKWLTTKNGNRCFGCSKSLGYFETFSAPTIAEVVMWLYEKHGMWVYTSKPNEEGWVIHWQGLNNYPPLQYYNSPTEAYEAAITYTLENLI